MKEGVEVLGGEVRVCGGVKVRVQLTKTCASPDPKPDPVSPSDLSRSIESVRRKRLRWTDNAQRVLALFFLG